MPLTRVAKLTKAVNKKSRQNRFLEIIRDGVDVSPCAQCFNSLYLYFVSTSRANRFECTLQGRKCRCEFSVEADYKKMSDQMDKVEMELAQASSDLSTTADASLEAQRAVNDAMAKVHRLEAFLKELGTKMVEHDAVLDPGSAEPSAQTSVTRPSLAATSMLLTPAHAFALEFPFSSQEIDSDYYEDFL